MTWVDVLEVIFSWVEAISLKGSLCHRRIAFFFSANIDFHLSLRLRAPGHRYLHQYSQEDNEGLGQGHTVYMWPYCFILRVCVCVNMEYLRKNTVVMLVVMNYEHKG